MRFAAFFKIYKICKLLQYFERKSCRILQYFGIFNNILRGHRLLQANGRGRRGDGALARRHRARLRRVHDGRRGRVEIKE